MGHTMSVFQLEKGCCMNRNGAIEALNRRRSQYALGPDLPISHAQAEALIRQAVRLSPSSFNSQSSRALILFGAQSVKFWDLVREALRPVVPEDAFETTSKKLDGFAAGAGTVLFFEDQDVVKGLQARFPLYADNFPIWSEQSGGMAQFAVWLALAEAGIGASLQHYNPLVDAVVRMQWQVPESWLLRAQMPFGSHQGPFAEKTFIDDAQRFIVAS